jgi:hypothetical protein
MTRNKLGDLQRDILHSLSRNKVASKRKSMTVRQIRLKIRPDTPSIYSTEQNIRRALRQLQKSGYVVRDGNWADLHSESWEWKLTDHGAQLTSLEIQLSKTAHRFPADPAPR